MLQTYLAIPTVIYLCLGAAGSGLAGVAAVTYLHSGARYGLALKASIWVSLALLLIGALFLLLDLGRPFVALPHFFSNFGSWATRGFWLLLGSLLVYSLFLVSISRAASRTLAAHWPFYRRRRNTLATVLACLVIGLSASVAAYTGFLLYECLGVPFWRNLLLPALFLCGSVNLGLSGFCWISALGKHRLKPGALGFRSRIDIRNASTFGLFAISRCSLGGQMRMARGEQSWQVGESFRDVQVPLRTRGARGERVARGWQTGFFAAPEQIIALLIEAVVLTLYLVWASNGSFEAVVVSYQYFVFGELAWLFWLGVVSVGLATPLLATLFGVTAVGRRHSGVVATIVLVATTLGLVALRYGIVFSGATLH